MNAKLLHIFTTAKAGARLEAVDQAELEAGSGLVGDRYYGGAGTFSKKLAGKPDREVTLIEAEEIDRFNHDTGLALGYGDLRRNLITSGVRLNDLVDRRFRVGECLLEGIRLCEPCAYLARTVAKEVLSGLVHKAGLRARIISGGTIRPGDEISATGGD
jgi:MOSC domain-containing protein YiiM